MMELTRAAPVLSTGGWQGAYDVTASLKVGSVTLRAPLLLDRRLLG